MPELAPPIEGFRIRRAAPEDLERIVELIAAGAVRPGRDSPSRPLDPAYAAALAEIDADPNNAIYVGELEGEVIATLQLTFIRQLSLRGGLVAQLESVFVDAALRSRGIGAALVRFALDEARRRGAVRAQLTSNLARADAHRFYERLGFVASHRGMKRDLDAD